MKVLVTGGSGAIGSMVVDELIRDGHEAVVFSRYPSVPAGVDTSRVSVVAGSTENLDDVANALEDHGVTGVIHLAASLIGACERDPVAGFRTNVLGSLHVFEAARRVGIRRVVYTSGKGVYGALKDEHAGPSFAAVPESHTGDAVHVYGATKQATELAAAHFARVFEMELVGLRLGSTFGPGKAATGDGYASLKPRIIEAAIHGRPMEVPYADVVDDLVYNRDVARAHVAALMVSSSSLRQPAYNISGGELVSIRDFVAVVRGYHPGAEFVLVEPYELPAGRNTRGRLEISAAARDLGFSPRYPGVTGIEEYLRLQQAIAAPG